MLNRAYSLLAIKSVDAELRVITGIATTPSTDRMGDIVKSEGAEFKLPIPLLWQHDSRQPIGEVFAASVTAAGIEIKARIAKIDEPGTLKDRLDEAWQSLKSGLVKGLSIGFQSLEDADIKGTYGIRFLKWLWLELSAVTIPANGDANIQTVKQCDIGRPALGNTPVRRSTTPGASGSRVVHLTTKDTKMPKPISEQIAGFEAKRAAQSAKATEVMQKANDEGRTLDPTEKETYDTLLGEVKEIDEHLVRLADLEKTSKALAKPVVADTQEKASESRGGGRVITLKRHEEPGLRFARMAMCIAASKGSRMDAMDLAKTFYGDDPGIQEFVKTAVAGATTSNAQGPLLQYTDLLTEFVDYLRPLTILGKFGGPIPNSNGIYPALTRVPFNVRVGTQTAGATGSWVGEGKPAPLAKGTFGTATLDFFKLAAISVLTKEEIRFTSIPSELKVRNDLANALIAKADSDFVDPSNTGTAGSKPASITNNVVAVGASGTTAVAFANDISTMVAAMFAAGIQPGSLVLIMSQQTALKLSLMRTSLGIRNYPDLTMYGGYVEGIPVIASEAMTSVGSPSTPTIIAVNAKDVFLADDGVVTIEASDQASLEMSDGPAQDGTSGGGASMVSLWQTGMLGLKATREINWKLMRAASCQYISAPAYVPQ